MAESEMVEMGNVDEKEIFEKNKEIVNMFANKLKTKFQNKLYFEYSLNLNDINKIIDETLREMIT